MVDSLIPWIHGINESSLIPWIHGISEASLVHGSMDSRGHDTMESPDLMCDLGGFGLNFQQQQQQHPSRMHAGMKKFSNSAENSSGTVAAAMLEKFAKENPKGTPGKRITILSIDGGGVRGLVPLVILIELERILQASNFA
ncbi:unnamed protein product [Sphagnum jensenii]|uniref:PNPLA domain-containing protein n=1 Tax=Sphagnum jensenii TaxID=128206 RepID=A0ABP1AF80_9BRYO